MLEKVGPHPSKPSYQFPNLTSDFLIPPVRLMCRFPTMGPSVIVSWVVVVIADTAGLPDCDVVGLLVGLPGRDYLLPLPSSVT